MVPSLGELTHPGCVNLRKISSSGFNSAAVFIVIASF
jgi:hypothetical protein